MSSVELVPEMYARVEQIAQLQHTTVGAVLSQAVKRYIWEMQREIIAKETRAFRSQHAELKRRYLGRWIAMRQAQVVDTDADLNDLRKRVRARFGLEPILMTQVQEDADPLILKRGFSLETP